MMDEKLPFPHQLARWPRCSARILHALFTGAAPSTRFMGALTRYHGGIMLVTRIALLSQPHV